MMTTRVTHPGSAWGANTDSNLDGITTGGVLGGVAGLAVGAGALFIPGIGPLIAAGPIAGLLSGAVTGGIAGGLIDWGIPAEESHHYEEDVKQGKTLVAVHSSGPKLDDAAHVLRQHGAHDVKYLLNLPKISDRAKKPGLCSPGFLI